MSWIQTFESETNFKKESSGEARVSCSNKTGPNDQMSFSNITSTHVVGYVQILQRAMKDDLSFIYN